MTSWPAKRNSGSRHQITSTKSMRYTTTLPRVTTKANCKYQPRSSISRHQGRPKLYSKVSAWASSPRLSLFWKRWKTAWLAGWPIVWSHWVKLSESMLTSTKSWMKKSRFCSRRDQHWRHKKPHNRNFRPIRLQVQENWSHSRRK